MPYKPTVDNYAATLTYVQRVILWAIITINALGASTPSGKLKASPRFNTQTRLDSQSTYLVFIDVIDISLTSYLWIIRPKCFALVTTSYLFTSIVLRSDDIPHSLKHNNC